MTDWDPIGVSDVPEAQDEYDGYVSIFVALLTRGASDEEIVRALHAIETETMGLAGSPLESLEVIARKLRAEPEMSRASIASTALVIQSPPDMSLQRTIALPSQSRSDRFTGGEW